MQKGLVEPEQYRAEFSTEKLHAEQQLRLGNEMADDFIKINARYEKDHQRCVDYVNTHRDGES